MRKRETKHRRPAGHSSQEGAAARPPAALALQRAAGNRAVARSLQRMEAAQAAETLEQALATGVYGAERQVTETLRPFAADTAGYAELAEAYEQRTETALTRRPPSL